MRKILVILGLALSSVTLAQESAHHQLKLQTFNAGGNPQGGIVPASANYRMKLDAVGEGIQGVALSSAAFLMDPCFVATLPLAPGASAGRVADDGCVSPAGPPSLEVTRNSITGNITLSWGTSCLGTDSDFEIYEGTMGSYYSHTAKFCTTGGLLNKTFAPPADDTYYVVVPTNAAREGSYGISRPSGVCGGERPAGTLQCESQQVSACP